MSKLVQREWARYGQEVGEDLPKLTASIGRKVAVTTLREIGADRFEQTILAKHMAHDVKTADKYYDKSNQRGARNAVVGKVTKAYVVSII